MAMTLERATEELTEFFGARGYFSTETLKAWAVVNAHLSAQAKARVTDEDAESLIAAVYGNDYCDYTRTAEVKAELESFAARLSQGAQSSGNSGELADDDEPAECSSDPKVRVAYADGYEVGFAHGKSQGAQGEAVAKLDKPALVGHTQFGIGIAWSTVIGAAQRAYEWKDDKLSPEQIAAFYIAFPHLAPSHEKVKQSAERAAVPDGLDSLTDEQLMEFVAIGLRHAEVKNFQIGDLRPAFKMLKTMLIEAKKPCNLCGQIDHGQTGEHPCNSCGLPLIHDDVQPAAPTLAGKDGVK